MKPKSNPFLKSAALAASIVLSLGQATHAALFYWDGNSGNWDDLTKWSTDLAGTTDPAARPLASASDTLNFNTTPGNTATSTLYLNGNRGASSIVGTMNFNTSGATTLMGGISGTPANNNLYISTFTVSSGSGAVTIGDTAASPTAQVNLKSGSISITNNSTSLLTLANGLNSYGSGSTTTFTFTGSGNISSGGVIGNGTGTNVVAVTKTGAGTLTLSGVNTYSGTTTISDGIVRITNNNALGATNNGTTVASTVTARLELANGITTSSNEALSISARTTNEASLSNVSGNNTWAGTINTATGGGLYNLESQAGLLSITGNLLNGNTGNRTWQLMGAGDGAISGIIADGSGTVSVTKYSGSGTWTLSVANSYSGTTTVSAGVLRPTNANALGSTTGGTIASAGSLELTSGLTPNSAESLTISGAGDNNIGALRAGAGGGTWAGPIAIGTAGARLGATATNTLTVTGTIADGAANSLGISGQSGTGVVVINPTTSNTYTGATQIIRGTLRLGKTDALPVTTVLDVDQASSVSDAAVLDLAGFNQTAAGLQDSATSNVNGKITNSVPATTSTLTLNQSTNSFFDGVIENGAGTVELIKQGSGRIALNGANTYTGATSVNAGRLNIGGSLTSPVTVASGAAIGGEGTLSNSLTFAAGTNNLFFDSTTPGALVATSVSATGAQVAVTPEGALTTGDTYVVLTNNAGFSGTVSDSYMPASRGTLAFGGALSGGLPTELQFTAAAPVTTLTWKGNASPANQWDINTTANWDNGSGADVFFNSDSLAFDDTATTTTITIQPVSVNVGAMNFNNPTKSYSISGGSIIGTGGLVKDGAASLTLSNANSFTGGTTLNAGTLNINNASALGSATGAFVITGGTIDNTSGGAITTVNYPLTIDTDVVFTGTNDLNLGAGATNLGSTTATSRTITTTGGTLRLGGVIANGSGGASEIVKAGNGTLTLAGASTYTGLTTVSAGTLKLGASGGAVSGPLGAPGTGTVIQSGATLDFAGLKAYAEGITISGTGVSGNGALINSGVDQINAVQALTLSAHSSIGGNGGRFDLRQNTAAPTLDLAGFTLTKSGSNTVALVGTSVTPGTGHIDITGGSFSVQTTTTMGGSASNTISVRNGATLDCYQSGTWTAPVWSVLMDAGSSFTNSNGSVSWDGPVTLNGAASAGGAGNLTLNGIVGGASGSLTKTGIGRLTLTNANTYAGGTVINSGTLYLDSPSTPAILGNVALNSNSVTATRAILILAQSNQLENSSNITINLAGTGTVFSDFALRGNNQTIASINASWDAGITGNVFVENRIFGETGGGSGVLTINGSSNSDLGSKVVIRDGGSGTLSLVKAGSGTLSIGGASTYTGTTTVNGGTLHLTGSLATGSAVTVGGATATGTPTLTGAGGTVNGTLNIAAAGGGAAGTVNPGTAGTTGTLNVANNTTIAGTYACDVSGASSDLLAVTGNLDITGATLAVSGTLTAPSYTIATYTGTLSGSFAVIPALPAGYTLDTATTGQIKIVLSATDYDTWMNLYPSITAPADKLPGADPDGDGLTNENEYAFGLAPNSGSSVNPILVQLDKTTGTFTYQRRSSTGLTYTILKSADLVTWNTASATQTPSAPDANNVQTVTVTLSGAPLADAKMFVRVAAAQP